MTCRYLFEIKLKEDPVIQSVVVCFFNIGADNYDYFSRNDVYDYYKQHNI